MRYDKDNDRLLLSVRELVSTARRGISSTLPCDTDEPVFPTSGGMQKSSENERFSELNFDFTAGKYSFTLHGRALINGPEITLYVPVDSSPKRPKREVTAQARGEAYIYAYMLSKRDSISDVKIIYVYFNLSSGEENEVHEILKEKKLESFFEKCKMSIIVYAKPEI